MSDELTEKFVRAVAHDLLERYPRELVESYRDLPGRTPAGPSRQVAAIIAKLDGSEAALLVRAAIDAALFRIFYLLDNPAELGDLSIKIIEAAEPNWDRSFHETYRTLVQPEGLLPQR